MDLSSNYQSQEPKTAAKRAEPKTNETYKSVAQDSNNTFSSLQESTSSTSTPTYTQQQINQQQIDESPVTTQLNKMLKKTRKDTEKKMLLDEDF